MPTLIRLMISMHAAAIVQARCLRGRQTVLRLLLSVYEARHYTLSVCHACHCCIAGDAFVGQPKELRVYFTRNPSGPEECTVVGEGGHVSISL